MHDFFDYNQLQNNELAINISEFDLTDLVKEVADTIKCQLQSNTIKFVLKDESLRKYNTLNGSI